MNLQSPRVHVQAGPQRVSAAFLRQFEAPVDDILAPQDYTLADSQIGSGFGITTLPHVRDFSISGPFKVTGVSDTVSRRQVFSCRPTALAEELPCATEILKRLASQAYREPVSTGRCAGAARLLREGPRRRPTSKPASRRPSRHCWPAPASSSASSSRRPRPASARPSAWPTSTWPRACSFFLWGSGPDAALVAAATAGALKTTAGLDREVRRMIADPRSEALSTRFARQWLRLQDVEKIRPDALLYPSLGLHAGREPGARDRALLRQPRARRSQHPRHAARRLHLRERARGAPLRHPERDGRGVPPRAMPDGTPRRPRARAASCC